MIKGNVFFLHDLTEDEIIRINFDKFVTYDEALDFCADNFDCDFQLFMGLRGND